MYGDVILMSIVFLLYFSAAILFMYNNVFCFFSLFFSVFLCLLVCQFLFLVASFAGLRPVLVTSHCSLRSLANKLRSFVRSFYVYIHTTQ